ncbi:MAG: peptidoglycan DD-metalloendopeptidase family protein [Rhodobacteraceae bacterium]|uniref:M23 family metallopeptidase n=1 Tax=Albidovulum sp. TaxID=1872424 RepID=UPI001D288431|nr:M23 family metallopeptidase [uncultured Defluviimonas sp.]MCB2124523.1 peptidoglycan DD-metalloendopeptidase family protein [Paracoccaceae bacterium]MCC0068740.1 peptidoglycan DD-metalloendopeptidase family protein [Paracoccaceae bacterium]
MPARLIGRFNAALERRIPEQRLFLRSDSETRFIRLRPVTQAVAMAGFSLLLAWTIVATAILLMDSIGSGSAREQARREQANYEARLDALSVERDQRAQEAVAAQERFALAMRQVSAMQSALLASEERRKELETGIGVIQATLRRTMGERDQALARVTELAAVASEGPQTAASAAPSGADVADTLGVLTAALGRTAAERDAMAELADAAKSEADEVAYEKRLLEERHDEIFASLEEAVTISMAPLDKMFSSAGLDPDDLIEQVRRGYSGQGGPLGPLVPPVAAGSDDSAERAGRILEGLDRMNLYRLAVEKAPFAMPLKTSFRYTSGFGRRWGRAHEGIDMAGALGSPVYATAEGTVVHAGWESGYGNMVEIRHEFGLATRYGHLSKVRVEVGQRVSRGDRIGDMGNTGRSTGTHLHYEVRTGGTAVNPMTFIKAANNVF